MSERYPGGFISKNAPTVSTSGAQGVWTLEQQAAYQKAGQWPFGGPFNYIEDVFSTYLYTGNGSTQTITNGIDLAGKGGLVWQKMRSDVASHLLTDTARGSGYALVSNSTGAQFYNSSIVSSFNSNGFTDGGSQASGATYASWTFRKQPKFFDIVTYTGNGTAGRTVAHNLGAVPGFMVVKRTDVASSWFVYHRSLGGTKYLELETTNSAVTTNQVWNDTDPTSTVFTLGSTAGVNGNGNTFVAYLFAHNAGGFGLTGTDNVISCGSYTGTGDVLNNITLGWEPQWLLVKNTTSGTTVSNWEIFDNMRGWPNAAVDAAQLRPNTSEAEQGGARVYPTATGFATSDGSDRINGLGSNYIYIAIRRGPMKTPTSGTSVFAPIAATNTTGTTNTTNFPVDLQLYRVKDSAFDTNAIDRLRGISSNATESGVYLQTNDTNSEYDALVSLGWDNVSFKTIANLSSSASVWWNFRRAPGFFDEVCYTGTGSATTFSHNLGVVPELMIVKRRDAEGGWFVYSSTLGATKYLVLQGTNAEATAATVWNNTTPTSSVFTVATASAVNASGGTYANYLFASCPGVSKVGSYTGTGGTQTISCGFAARFVLIKRTNSTGNWWVWDTARGMVAGTDPRLALNSTAAESNADWVYTDASGFQIVTTDATVNASGGSYIFLAIA